MRKEKPDNFPPELSEKLKELVRSIRKLPSISDRTRLNQLVEDLRLPITYILFDQEAQKRENQYLRRMLEHQGNDDGESG